MDKTHTKDALLEIYTEEIPVSFISPALEQMKTIAGQLFDERKLLYKNIRTYATPRRLVLYVEGLAERTERQEEEILGPAVKVAFDDEGPTGAARGFARNHGLEVKQLKTKDTPKGSYVCVVKVHPSISTETVLKDVFKNTITNITFPKSMVWEHTRFWFARPVRSILALYGSKVVKFDLAGIRSANYTYGLFVITQKKIRIPAAEKYLSMLRNNHVLVDQDLRRDTVNKVIGSVAKTLKGKTEDDQALIAEINYLVEHPVAVAGSFPEQFLSLPEEVLVTCMKKKQRFFPVRNTRKKLTNNFIGIRNGISEGQQIVREGYERVLIASLNDAQFFYTQDTRTKLETKIEKLKGVIFHNKLGTLHDKILRVEKIAAWIAERTGNTGSLQAVRRAVQLCKADLVTNLVFEYPELQGTAGRIYAAKDGEEPEVARAIEEHYWPMSADHALPENMVGNIVAIADKMDTIVCNFAIGIIPTGSGDQYGLRRQATGVLRMIREKKIPILLHELTEYVFGVLPVKPEQTVIAQVMEFFRQRFEPMLTGEGFKFDEVRAVLVSCLDNIGDCEERLKALKKVRSQPDFEPIIAAYKRAGNILKQARKKEIPVNTLTVSQETLQQEEEKQLYNEFISVKDEVTALLREKKYFDSLLKLVSLRKYVDSFFDKVKVMDEDENLRNNRIALLNDIVSLFTKIGNLSLLQ